MLLAPVSCAVGGLVYRRLGRVAEELPNNDWAAAKEFNLSYQNTDIYYTYTYICIY